MRKQILISILAVFVIVLVLIIGFYKPFQPSPSQSNPEDDLTRPFPTQRVLNQETKNTLTVFPAGFPMEGQFTKSFKYIPANSLLQQSTVEYESQATMAENQTIFLKYLADSGFQIANKTEEQNITFYYASKADADLSVMLKDQNGKIFVTASYLQK